MDVLGATMEFKKDHPHNYWLRILCLAFCMVFMALWITEDVEAIGHYPVAETDYSYPLGNNAERATHTKDDTLVWGHTPGADSIVVTYKESGGSWTNYTIHTAGDDDYYRFGGVVNTLNNTVVLHYGAKIGSSDTFIAIKWPGSDWNTWTIVKIGDNRYPCDIAVNDTDILGITATVTTSSYTIYYWYYDLDALLGTPDNEIGTTTGVATSNFGNVQVLCNMTGVFFFGFTSGTISYWSDFGVVFGTVQVYSSPNIIHYWGVLENDRLFGVGHLSNTGRPYIFAQTTHEQVYPWTRTYLEQGASGDTYEYGAIAVSIKQNSTQLSIVTYCNTHEEVVTWTGDWDYTELQWDGVKAHTGISDPDDVAFMGNFGGIWPVHPSTGIRWTRPQSGWALFARNESGGTDTFDLWYDSINFTADLTTEDPEITTLSLPEATYGVFYSHTLEKANGTIPFVWTLLIKPSWMSIGAVNGTIYGTPDGTGTEQVRAKLADAVPRYDEVEWTLTINAASSGEGPWDGIWGNMWLDAGMCSSAGVVLLIILFAIGIMGIMGSWRS